jgi:hypothetical protein
MVIKTVALAKLLVYASQLADRKELFEKLAQREFFIAKLRAN